MTRRAHSLPELHENVIHKLFLKMLISLYDVILHKNKVIQSLLYPKHQETVFNLLFIVIKFTIAWFMVDLVIVSDSRAKQCHTTQRKPAIPLYK